MIFCFLIVLSSVDVTMANNSLGLVPKSSLLSLKDVPIPLVQDRITGQGLNAYIRNQTVAVALGKALFWDSNVGSDGIACASCHFHAGADNRTKNQLHPKKNNEFNQPSALIPGWGPNYDLNLNDLPLHQLANASDRNSMIIATTDDVIGSSGSQSGIQTNLVPRVGVECNDREIDLYHVNGKLTRLTTDRNAPTVINAVFNFRNFWDGRANNIFNGVTSFGRRDSKAQIVEKQLDGSEKLIRIELKNASLASQAVGPALSIVEMTCALKGFKELGRKLLLLRPLMNQQIHVNDSVLEGFRSPTGQGLIYTYGQLIKSAFDRKYWSSTKRDSEGYTQLERNFSFFWGLALQAYQSTLISDETPYDKFIGDRRTVSIAILDALSYQEQRGLALFMGKGRCINCHKGAEFTSAATLLQSENNEEGLVERMLMGNGISALYDNGFYNIGVTPTIHDLGLGGKDPFGYPLSLTRQYIEQLLGSTIPDVFQVDECQFENLFQNSEFLSGNYQLVECADHSRSITTIKPIDPSEIKQLRVAIDGSFKVPTLRNIALTAPYFHNGGTATLEQVVEFYNRGGNRRGDDVSDTTGYGVNNSNLDPDITELELTTEEQADLVAFLRYSLTDRRVACELAPFDHPSLSIPHGHKGNYKVVEDINDDGKADDSFLVLPAIGKDGLPASGYPCYINDGHDQLSRLKNLS